MSRLFPKKESNIDIKPKENDVESILFDNFEKQYALLTQRLQSQEENVNDVVKNCASCRIPFADKK